MQKSLAISLNKEALIQCRKTKLKCMSMSMHMGGERERERELWTALSSALAELEKMEMIPLGVTTA